MGIKEGALKAEVLVQCKRSITAFDISTDKVCITQMENILRTNSSQREKCAVRLPKTQRRADVSLAPHFVDIMKKLVY